MARGDVTLELNTEKRGDVSIVRVRGRITINKVDTIHDYLVEILEEGVRKFLLDLGDLEHIVSGGIGALIGFNEKVRDAGGVIIIANIHPRVDKIFQLMSLDTFFTIQPTIESGLKSLNGK